MDGIGHEGVHCCIFKRQQYSLGYYGDSVDVFFVDCVGVKDGDVECSRLESL